MRNESEDSLRAIAAAYRMTYDLWAGLVSRNRVSNSYCHAAEWTLNEMAAASSFRTFSYAHTRYTWINLAAYTMHDTFEVRLHQGSLNACEIMNWVRAHTTFADYASKVGGWEAIRDEFDKLSTSEKFDRICEIWTAAGCEDLAGYYAAKARANGRFIVKETYAAI
jgi:hypothetical protein